MVNFLFVDSRFAEADIEDDIAGVENDGNSEVDDYGGDGLVAGAKYSRDDQSDECDHES